jgi:HSP20 family protein
MSDETRKRKRSKRQAPFSRDSFGDVDRFFEEMEKMMEEEFEKFTEGLPKEYARERRLPDGSIIREFGPFVHGYSVKITDGKPEVREFGNVRSGKRGPLVMEEREPLIDVVESEGEIHVVAELPGVETEDIKLKGVKNTLTISVDAPQHKYYKTVDLPVKVNVNQAKTTYKNGVLEVILPKPKKNL